MGCTSLPNFKNEKAKMFYHDLSSINPGGKLNKEDAELSENIQIKVSITQIEKGYTYKIRLLNIKDYNQKSSLNEYAECICQDNMTANLDLPIIIRYFFEIEQPLKIEILKTRSDDSETFQVDTTLGCVMGSRKNTYQTNIFTSKHEILILKVEKLNKSEEVIRVSFDIKSNKKVSFEDIKNKMYFEIFSDIILYRSECINKEGIFDPIKIPLGLFKDKKIIIKFYNSSRQSCGNFTFNIDDFTNRKTFNIKINGTQFQIISKSFITQNFTFVDYLKAGIEIGLSIAIDFTKSNGPPYERTSLHYIHDIEKNQYERAIWSCGNIVAYYDYDQLFPCFGFGAKVQNEARDLFNLNFQDDPNVKYIDGIIDAYHNAVNAITFYGPTYFGPILSTINKIIKDECYKLKYHILMILTDGKIDDIDNTIDALVEGSFLPLSVIIIGVGNANFDNMKILDADENPLIDSKGVKAVRDLVQFVPFIKYESNPEKLANEVLAEIPRQLMEYYEQNNLDPIKLTT